VLASAYLPGFDYAEAAGFRVPLVGETLVLDCGVRQEPHLLKGGSAGYGRRRKFEQWN
jgi:hypothetical protein